MNASEKQLDYPMGGAKVFEKVNERILAENKFANADRRFFTIANALSHSRVMVDDLYVKRDHSQPSMMDQIATVLCQIEQDYPPEPEDEADSTT